MRSFLMERLRGYATGMLALRAVIIGLNFGVMIGLAAWLGLSIYGALVFLWGLALIAATVLSVGGPLILLRDLTNGSGVRKRTIFRLALLQPLMLAFIAFFMLDRIWPDQPWLHVLFAALAINALVCLASILRAQGAIGQSMMLRDGGPMLALGTAVVWPATAETMLACAAISMSLMTVFGLLLYVRPTPSKKKATGKTECGGTFSLWGTSILGMAIAQMDLIIGGIFLPPEVFGLYAVLRRVANVVALPVSVATWVSATAVSGARDTVALQTASATGSRIAWSPAIALAVIAVSGLCLTQLFAATALPIQMNFVFLVLLGGAVLQAFWASGFTVATLTQFPHLSAFSRMMAVAIYGLGAMYIGADLSALSNAFLYVFAISVSSFFLWAVLGQRLGVDTSAAVLWRKKGVAWNLS